MVLACMLEEREWRRVTWYIIIGGIWALLPIWSLGGVQALLPIWSFGGGRVGGWGPGPPSHLVLPGRVPSFYLVPWGGGGSRPSPLHHGKSHMGPPQVGQTDWQTNTIENITFPHYVAGGKYTIAAKPRILHLFIRQLKDEDTFEKLVNSAE